MNSSQELKLRGLLRDKTLEDARTGVAIPAQMQKELDAEQSYCGNPDFRDEEIANSDPDTVCDCLGLDSDGVSRQDAVDIARAIIKLHQQTPLDGAEAAGSGSWRKGCQHTAQWAGEDDHAMTYFVERNTFSTNWRRAMLDSEYQDIVDLEVYDETVANTMGVGSPFGRIQSIDDCKRVFVHQTEESATAAGVRVGDPLDVLDLCWRLTEEIYRRVGCLCVRVYTGPNGQHNGHSKGKNLPGSLAGWAEFNDGRCGSHVNMVLDNLLASSFLRLLNLTGHECGHWKNLLHQFRNQHGEQGHHEWMSYSTIKWSAQGFSNGQPPFRLPQAPSLRPLQGFFDYEAHIPPVVGGPPPTTPGPTLPGELYAEQVAGSDTIAIRGVLYPRGEYDGTEYIAVPQPGSSEKVYVMQRKPEV